VKADSHSTVVSAVSTVVSHLVSFSIYMLLGIVIFAIAGVLR
jgi:hypothetical protein